MATTNIQSFSGDVEVAGELTVTGQLNSTTGSDKVKLTATTTNETDYIPLSKGTTSAQALYTDSNLTYNPSNNVIGANISGNASFATNATYANSAGSATNATYATSAGSAQSATNATYANNSGGYAFYNNQLGYSKFREGNAAYTLINWGKTGNIGIGQSSYQTFRAAFANIYSVVTTRIESTGGQSFAWSSGQISNSGFRVYSNGARVGSWYWIAIGRG